MAQRAHRRCPGIQVPFVRRLRSPMCAAQNFEEQHCPRKHRNEGEGCDHLAARRRGQLTGSAELLLERVNGQHYEVSGHQMWMPSTDQSRSGLADTLRPDHRHVDAKVPGDRLFMADLPLVAGVGAAQARIGIWLSVIKEDDLLAATRGRVEHFSGQLVLEVTACWATVDGNDQAAKLRSIDPVRVILQATNLGPQFERRHGRLGLCGDPNSLRLADVAVVKPNLVLEVAVARDIVVNHVKNTGQRDVAGRPEEAVADRVRTGKVGLADIVDRIEVDVSRHQLARTVTQSVPSTHFQY